MSKQILVAMVSMVMGSAAMAATQGTLGATSSGTSVVSISKGHLVRISDIADFTFGAQTSTPAKSNDNICIYSTSGSYTVTASSANGSGSLFRMADSGATNFVNYTVEWNNAASGTSGTALTNTVASATQTGADTSSTTCSGSTNARLFVQVDNTTFTAAPSGVSYTDTLTLLVAPM